MKATKIVGGIALAATLSVGMGYAQELQTQNPIGGVSVMHTQTQEADLLLIASNGALNNTTSGVQVLTLEEQQAVQGGGLKGKLKKFLKKAVARPFTMPPIPLRP